MMFWVITEIKSNFKIVISTFECATATTVVAAGGTIWKAIYICPIPGALLAAIVDRSLSNTDDLKK